MIRSSYLQSELRFGKVMGSSKRGHTMTAAEQRDQIQGLLEIISGVRVVLSNSDRFNTDDDPVAIALNAAHAALYEANGHLDQATYLLHDEVQS